MGNVTSNFSDGTIWPVISVDTNGNYVAVSGTGGGTGNVAGPASSTDNAIATWSGTAGTALRNTNLTFSANALASASSLSISAAGGNLALVGNTSITVGSDITPLTSGTYVNGSVALPWSKVTANQYATTQISGITTASTKTVDWNTGNSQIINFVGSPSGTCTITLSNGIAGSFYSLKTMNNISGTTSVAWASGTTSWPAGVPANLTLSVSAQDLFGFYYDGAKYMGNQIANFS